MNHILILIWYMSHMITAYKSYDLVGLAWDRLKVMPNYSANTHSN